MTKKKTRGEERAAWLRQRSTTRTKRRKCDRCGKVGYYAPHQRACQQLIGLLGAYRCPGTLASLARRPKRTLQEGIAVMMTEPDVPTHGSRLRAAAQRKVAAATLVAERWQVRFNKQLAHVRRYGSPKWALRLATSAREANRWSKKAQYYAKRVEMTDAQLEADAERVRRAFARKPGRGMRLAGSV